MFIFLISNCYSFITAYKTVVLVHGLNSDEGEFSNLKPRIEELHPGTNVVGLHYSPNPFSLDPIPVQLVWFEREIGKVLETTDDDIHLVCHSQGMSLDMMRLCDKF